MEHIESDLKVYATSDYSRFRMIEGNRQLNEKKIKNIIADIEDGIDVLKNYPINVFENGSILDIEDGQHRFYIARKLRRPVHYILMSKTLDLSEIAKVNSNVEKWTSIDFVNCYIQLNNDHYLKLQQFMDEYGLSVTLSIQLLSKGTPEASGNKDTEGFQRGRFEAKFVSEAQKLAAVALQFKGFKGYKSRSFFVALHKIILSDKVKTKDLIEKVVKHLDKLYMQESYKKYIENLESVYNIGRKDRVILHE